MSDLFPPVQQFLRGQAPLSSVELAITEGADLNQWNGPQTPLKCAIQAHSAILLHCLLLGKANPNEKDAKGVTPLHVAVFEGKGEEVRVLLDAAADVNALDRHGQTALFFAPSRHMCEILISRDADINIKNSKHQSALHLAAYAGLNDTVAWLAQLADKDMLDAKDKNGNSAVYYAAHAKVKSTVAVLQSKGADVSVKSTRDKVRYAKSIAAAARQPSVAEHAPLDLPSEPAAAEEAVAAQAAEKAGAEKAAAEKVAAGWKAGVIASPDPAADAGATPLPANALRASRSGLEPVPEENPNLADAQAGLTPAFAQSTGSEVVSSSESPPLQQPEPLEGSEKDLRAAAGERPAASSQLSSLSTDLPLPKQTVAQIQQGECVFWEIVLMKKNADDKYGFVQANGRLDFKQRLAITNQGSNNNDIPEQQVSNSSTTPSTAPDSPTQSVKEDFSIAGPEVLVVRRVNQDGPLGVWNRQNPGAAVKAQDRIVSVNGETTVDGMQHQILTSEIRIKLCRYPERFIVALSKEEGQRRLGFRFEKPTGQHLQELRISEVLKEGALPDFNARQGELGLWHFAVLPDMRIEKANDVMGDACEMAEELKRCENVTLQIRRAESVSLTRQQVRARLQTLASFRTQKQQQQLRTNQQEALTKQSGRTDDSKLAPNTE